MQRFFRSGHLVTVPAAVALLVVLVAAAVHSASSRLSSSGPSPKSIPSAAALSLRPAWAGGALAFTEPALDSTLRRVALDPSALTAAGVTSQLGVEAVVGAVRTHLTEHGTALSVVEADWRTSKAQYEALERLVRRGKGTEQDLIDLAAARSEMNSDRSSLDSALDGVFDAGVDGLTAEVITRLTAIRAHRATVFRELPVQHLVESRTDSDLVTLRDALDEERICAKWNEQVSGNTTTLLSNERARTEVAQASSRLDSSLASVETYWDAAVEP